MIFTQSGVPPRLVALVFGLMTLLTLTGPTNCFAAKEAAEPKPRPAVPAKPQPVPDVIVLVLSGAFPSDGVSFTYNGVVPDSVARTDLKYLLAYAGWQAKEIKVSRGAAEPKATSVEFQVDGAVNWGSGALQVEPFVLAFKRFKLIQVNYILQGDFPFRSLRNFSNQYVDVDWLQTENTHSYTIKIKDHNFERLGLPTVVEPPSQASTQPPEKPIPRRGGRVWIVLVLAAAAAAIVVVIATRVSRR